MNQQVEKVSATSGNFKLLNQQVENRYATSGKIDINKNWLVPKEKGVLNTEKYSYWIGPNFNNSKNAFFVNYITTVYS